jgi:hypothetical protein
MAKKSIFSRLRQCAALLLAVTLACSGTAFGQANYWSIFGPTGSSCATNQMNCRTAASSTSSFSGLSDLADLTSTGIAQPTNFQNAAYDGAGNLIFSVNHDGIYAPSGTQVMDFTPSSPSVTIGSYSLTPGFAWSEIVIFPVPGQNNNYYVMFWTNDINYGHHYYEIRAVKVVVSSSGVTCTDGVMLDNVHGPYQTNDWDASRPTPETPYHYVIAADAPNCDGTRDIYTVEPDNFNSGYYRSQMRKWTIAADGTLPNSSYDYYTHRSSAHYQTNAFSSKAKILNISGTKYLAYISGNTGDSTFGGTHLGVGDFVAFYTLMDAAGGATTAYVTSFPYYAVVSPDYQQINGFEYVPSKNAIYFSYTQFSAGVPSGGGLGYWTSDGAVHFVSSSADYANTDIEINNHGDLLLVKGTNPTTGGQLAYISASASLSTSTLPSVCSTSCGGSTLPVSVQNNIQSGLYTGAVSPQNCYYLCSQLRGEDYNSWGSYNNKYVVTGTETWTPTSNPVQSAAGVSSMNPIKLQNIEILPGASLTINGLTVQMADNVYIDIDNAAPGSSTVGGRLTLNNTILTRRCVSWGGIRVHGSNSASQYTLSSSSQGAVTMYGSTVAYAKIGVAAGNLSPVMGGGGGIVIAWNSKFTNNGMGAFFAPYQNFYSWAPATEITNQSYFRKCSFSSSATTIAAGTLIDIYAVRVKDINIEGCNFNNNSAITNSYAVKAYNAGIVVNGYPLSSPSSALSTFSNYQYGIYQNAFDADHTVSVQNSVFNKNGVGIALLATKAPIVVGNTFNIQINYTGYSYPWVTPSGTSISTIGLLLQAADQYSVYSNKFQSVVPLGVPPGSANNTVGVLAYNTGYGAENLINNNSYNGLGAANLCDYKNAGGVGIPTVGLWFMCNVMTNNTFDISVRGNDYSTCGIRNWQGIQPFTHYPGTLTPADPRYSDSRYYYLNGFPSGNSFSTGTSIPPIGSPWVENLSSPPTETYSFHYLYSGASGTSSLEIPGVPGTTGFMFGVTTQTVSPSDQCNLPSAIVHTTSGSGSVGAGSVGGVGAVPLSQQYDGIMNNLATLNNINYYAGDSGGVPSRDSLYYWANQLKTSAGDPMKAYLLSEDGYLDSGYTVYDSIQYKYTLDSIQKVELTTWGRREFSVSASILSYHRNQKNLIATAYNSPKIDSILSDSTFNAVVNAPYTLSAGALDTLVYVFDSSHYWARLRAEAILSLYAPDTLGSMLAGMPDTFLFPAAPDSVLSTKSPAGVLAVTEVSQGPAVGSGTQGCAYAEMLVSNCSTNSSLLVDVSGWIIDDNSGNFSTLSCTGDSSGITRGHYRLNPGSAIWQNIKVGSTIVVYNAGNNCYNLPDTFTVDSANAIYWVPVFDTALADTGYVLQRYGGGENTDAGTYCSDTGASVYTNAYGWEQTIKFNSPADAFQVRCPGCTVASPGTPAFYHGIGYAPDSTYCFSPVSAGTYGLGGPILYNYSSTNMKYSFIGGAAADFSDPSKWQVLDADTAGTPPLSLGYVDSTLSANVLSYALGLPCCSSGSEGRSTHHSIQPATGSEVSGIQVYPNPANMMLYFRFPTGDVTIKLTDVTGRVMDERTMHNSTQASFNVKSYAPGLYIYQVATKGRTQTGKVLIEK